MSYSLRSKAKGPIQANMVISDDTASSSTTASEPPTASSETNVFADFLANENDDREPTLRELKCMLMAIMKQMMKVDVLNSDVETIKEQQKDVINTIKTCTERVAVVEKRQDSIEQRCNDALKQLQVPIIGNEYNNKQYNILVYNVPVAELNERPETTRGEVKKVFKDVLNIDSVTVDSMRFASVHRLPANNGQRPPIIARFRSKFDKQTVWDNIKQLNIFNNKQKDETTKMYIDMNHLPYKLQQDKKSLLEQFKKAKNDGKAPKWIFSKKTGEYGYKIGTNFFKPASNFVTLEPIA